MKAIVNTAPGKLELLDLPCPEPGQGQVRIKTAACGICATDLEMIAGWARTKCPAVPGHEWSGRVDAAGPGVAGALLGRRCVAENVLADGGEVGFEHHGGYAEYLITEARNVRVLPPQFPLSVAALIEPLAVSVRALRRLNVRDKRAALILGDGPIGLLLLMLLRQAGVTEIALVGGRARRLALAKELGAAHVFNRHEIAGDFTTALKERFPALSPNVVEASGSAKGMEASLELAAREGKILVIGDYGSGKASFPWNQLLHRELELIGSNASAGAWPEAVRLATEGALPLERLITHKFPASRYAEGIELVKGRRADVIKVVLEWE
ncbi:MAG: zinc-binding dehydrogenase [Planctomycetota bacterium]|nr:zinc-binding dehydrogenase [Planctomycetota bacterium]